MKRYDAIANDLEQRLKDARPDIAWRVPDSAAQLFDFLHPPIENQYIVWGEKDRIRVYFPVTAELCTDNEAIAIITMMMDRQINAFKEQHAAH